MSYRKCLLPKRLLPKRRYRRLNFGEFPRQAFLIRRSLCSIIKNSADVDPKCIALNREHWIDGLSCNLFGVFRNQDIDYISKEDSWEPCSKIKKRNQLDCEYLENSIPIYISIDLIHNVDFPYNHDARVISENPTLQKINKKSDQYKNLISQEFKGSGIIIHRPTLANFWHFEIFFRDDKGEFIKEETKGFRTIVQPFIHSFLVNAASYNEPENYYCIPRKLYDTYLPCCLHKLFGVSAAIRI